MRWIRLAVVSMLGMFAFCGVANADATGNVNFFIGQKYLNGDWEDDSIGADFSTQREFGVLMSFGQTTWPIDMAIDFLTSSADDNISGVKLEGETMELDFGVRKHWGKAKTRPFIGGGLGWVKGELTGSASGISVSADDSSYGAWIDGGVFWRFGERFNLGLEGRYSMAKIEPKLGGTTFDMEAGGFHLGLLIGIGWGR